MIVTADAAPSFPPAITAIDYWPETDEVTLTWRNTGAASFVAKVSLDMIDWGSDLDDGIFPDMGDTTTRTFGLADTIGDGEGDVFFRIEDED